MLSSMMRSSNEFFQVGSRVDLSRGGRSCEISFCQLETKKTIILVENLMRKCQIVQSTEAEFALLLPVPTSTVVFQLW